MQGCCSAEVLHHNSQQNCSITVNNFKAVLFYVQVLILLRSTYSSKQSVSKLHYMLLCFFWRPVELKSTATVAQTHNVIMC